VKLGPAASGRTEKRRARHEKTTNQIQSEKGKDFLYDRGQPGVDMYGSRRRQLQRISSKRVPVACKTEQDAERITAHYTDAIELQVVQNIECYYLIPGTIVKVIKEDPARGMSEMRLGSITRSLWTYSRFLSKHPVKDTYGVIETPEKSGLIPTADTAILPALPSHNSTARTWQNGNP
jgi:hypothetical protein